MCIRDKRKKDKERVIACVPEYENIPIIKPNSRRLEVFLQSILVCYGYYEGFFIVL